jgi:hypothetical protein
MDALPRGRVPLVFALATLAIAIVGAQQPGGEARGEVAQATGKRFTLATKSFWLKRRDQKKRLVVRCPGGRLPLGGGMRTKPQLGADGQGVYPHSYERLGVQHGWHISAVLYNPTSQRTRPHRVTLQVMCGPKLGHSTPPHVTRYVRPGQTKTLVASCPGRRHLYSGGFQRTNWVSRGGNFATEARLAMAKKWRVSGSAFGGFGGELTAIAYCVRSKRPLLRVVSASTTLRPRSSGKATTTRCPGRRRLTSGGFRTAPAGSVFFTNGTYNRNGTWSASGFNRSRKPAKLTAYGYCLK